MLHKEVPHVVSYYVILGFRYVFKNRTFKKRQNIDRNLNTKYLTEPVISLLGRILG